MKNLLIWMTFMTMMAASAKASTRELHKHLFSPAYYNKRVRPTVDPNKPINVTLELTLHEIIDLNDKNQRLDLKVTIREHWIDPSLAWNKTQFNGVEFITVHPDAIWIPDVVLYNNAGEGFGDGVTRTEALVRHDGLVRMNIPSLLQSTCKVHLEKYPFDQQTCSITFGSWSYNAAQLSLKYKRLSADLSYFSPNVEWELLEMPAEFHSVIYPCCKHPFEDIEFFVKVKRRSLFHAMYLIIPCAVISLLTVLVFLLPPECNERMTVGMAILVGLSFFFLLVAENMPATSDTVPVIGLYYSVTMLEVSSAFFMTCFVLMCHHRNPLNGDLPDTGRKHLQVLARFLGFPFIFKKQDEKSEGDRKTSQSTNASTCTLTYRTSLASLRAKEAELHNNSNDADTILQEHIDNEEQMEKIQTNWKMAALVLNSLFMWIYVIAVLLTLSVLILTQMIPAL